MSAPHDRFTSLDGEGVDRRQARARHPTSRRRPDLARMAARMAERQAAEGHPWPDFAAAVIAERGHARLDRGSFAGRLGVSEEMLAGVEDGVLAGAAVSAALTEMSHGLDTVGADSPTSQTRRRPELI